MTPDYELYGGTPPHVDRDTSLAAAEAIEDSAASMRMQIHKHVIACGVFGTTDDEIEVAFQMRHQTASARRRELELQGLVKDSGMRRPTRSGRDAIVWIAANDPPLSPEPAESPAETWARRSAVFQQAVSALEMQLKQQESWMRTAWRALWAIQHAEPLYHDRMCKLGGLEVTVGRMDECTCYLAAVREALGD